MAMIRKNIISNALILIILFISFSAVAQTISQRPAIKGYNADFHRISTSPQIIAEHVCNEIWEPALERDVFVHEIIENEYEPPGWSHSFPFSYRFNCAFYGTHPDEVDQLFFAPSRGYHIMSWQERSNSDPNFNHTDCQQTEGNPIRVDLGEKIQTEKDSDYLHLQNIPFSRYYNSGVGQSRRIGRLSNNWTHTYSKHITFGNSNAVNPLPGIIYWYQDTTNRRWIPVSKILPPDYLSSSSTNYAYVVRANGKSIYFSLEQDSWVSDYGTGYQLRLLPNYEGWLLTTPKNEEEIYDSSGRLIQITNNQGKIKTLHYELGLTDGGDGIPATLDQVRDDEGNTLQFNYANNRLVEINTGNNDSITYNYSSAISLIESVRYPGDYSRNYHYQGSLLTGITDESGFRYVSWGYDSIGRAISSSSEDGINEVTLTYNFQQLDLRRNGTRGSVTATNPLNKQTTYHYTSWQGLAQLTRVEGHPTENCAGANKAYTYDANGFIASKTDWKGNVTTYTHNERGQELSRTEASGTPQARTITTEWHSEFNLPVRIVEPERETVMIYDENGRLLSRQVLEKGY